MTINRRRFLEVAALGVVATACSPDPTASPPKSTAPPVTTTTTSQAPIPPDWNALRSQLPGGLVLPGESTGIVPTPAWLRRTFHAAWQRIWYEGYSVNLSIGQGYLAVTPIPPPRVSPPIPTVGHDPAGNARPAWASPA